LTDAGHVAAWVVETDDESNLHRIGNGDENDRDGRCRRLCRLGGGGSEGGNHGRPLPD
jgi:hypothetical protein